MRKKKSATKRKASFSPVKRPGALTARAKKNNRSVQQQAEIDAHTKGTSPAAKRIRSEGAFDLARQKWKHAKGPRKKK